MATQITCGWGSNLPMAHIMIKIFVYDSKHEFGTYGTLTECIWSIFLASVTASSIVDFTWMLWKCKVNKH